MSKRSQLEQLRAEIHRRGALIDDLDKDAVKLTVGSHYPGLYRELVSQFTFVAFDVGGVRVHGNVKGKEDDLEGILEDKILTQMLEEAGFLPFGRPATGSYDRICFDVRGVKNPHDAPIVLMDHEAILSRNRLPRPKLLADGLMELFDLEIGR